MRSVGLAAIRPNSDEPIKVPSWRRAIFGIGFLAGTIVSLFVSLADEFLPGFSDIDIRDILLVAVTLGAAFAAVNIAVLALVAVWFDDIYQQVLKERGGWLAAMRPFRIVSTVSVLTTAVSLIGLFALTIDGRWVKAVVLGGTSGFLVWTLVGTLLVIAHLFEHGKHRAELVQKLRERRIAMGLPPQGR